MNITLIIFIFLVFMFFVEKFIHWYLFPVLIRADRFKIQLVFLVYLFSVIARCACSPECSF